MTGQKESFGYCCEKVEGTYSPPCASVLVSSHLTYISFDMRLEDYRNFCSNISSFVVEVSLVVSCELFQDDLKYLSVLRPGRIYKF